MTSVSNEHNWNSHVDEDVPYMCTIKVSLSYPLNAGYKDMTSWWGGPDLNNFMLKYKTFHTILKNKLDLHPALEEDDRP